MKQLMEWINKSINSFAGLTIVGLAAGAMMLAVLWGLLLAFDASMKEFGRAMGPLTLVVKGHNGAPDCAIGPDLKQCQKR